MRCLLALLALLWAIPACAGTWTPISAATSCTTSVTSCSANITASVPAGSTVVTVVGFGTSGEATAATLADNATTANCSGAYTLKKASYSASSVSWMVAYCPVTSGAMTGGATCGTGGTTQCAVTVSNSTSSYMSLQVYAVTGLNTAAIYDKTGTATGGTWTSATATTFAATPTLGYSSDDALVVVAAEAGGTTDTLTSYTSGFASVSSNPAGAGNRPEFFVSHRIITSGTATMGATPTSGAARAYGTVAFLFVNSGAIRAGCGGCGGLLGILR